MSRVVFILLNCMWFASPKNALKLLWRWNLQDFRDIVSGGAVKASTYALSSGMAVLTEFFIYYVLIDHKRLALRLTVAKDYVLPVGLGILGSLISGTSYGLWIGMTAAAGVSVALLFGLGKRRFRDRGFPYLIPSDRDENIFIYDFEITGQNAVEMSKTAGALLKEKAFSARTQYLVSLYAEELLMMILDRNASSGKAVHAECTLILEEEGAG